METIHFVQFTVLRWLGPIFDLQIMNNIGIKFEPNPLFLLAVNRSHVNMELELVPVVNQEPLHSVLKCRAGLRAGTGKASDYACSCTVAHIWIGGHPDEGLSMPLHLSCLHSGQHGLGSRV